MAFKLVRDDGARWTPEAGGYVKNGKVVSRTPEYDDDDKNNYKPAKIKQPTATIASNVRDERYTSKNKKKDKSILHTPISTLIRDYFSGPGTESGAQSDTQTVDTVSGAQAKSKSDIERADDYVKYFGSKDAYAEAIKQKLQSEQSFTDQAAAEAFIKSNPELFKTNENTTTKTGGSSNSTKTGGSSGSTKAISTPKNYVRDYFESKGYTVEHIPDSGNIRVYDPETGHSAMITSGSYKIDENTNRSYISPEVAQRVIDTIESGKYTYTGGSKSSGGTTEAATALTAGTEGQITDADRQNLAIRRYFENAGYTVDYDAETGNIRIYDPNTKSSAMITPGFYNIDKETGTTYTTPEVVQRVIDTIKSGRFTFPVGTQQQQPVEGQTSGVDETFNEMYNYYQDWLNKSTERLDKAYEIQNNMLNEYITKINDYMEQYGDLAVAMLKLYQDQYSKALEQLQNLMNPDPTVPETVKTAIDILKKNVDENIKQLNEEMNRRGIYQSGIAAEMERRLRENALTEEQKLLANWVDEQHNRAYDAAIRYASALQQYAGGYTDIYGRTYLEPLEQTMNLLTGTYQAQANLAQQRYADESELAKTALTLATDLRKWKSEREEALRKLEAEAEKSKQEWQQQLAKMLLERQLPPTQYQQELLNIARDKLEEVKRYHDITKQQGGNDIQAFLNFLEAISRE